MHWAELHCQVEQMVPLTCTGSSWALWWSKKEWLRAQMHFLLGAVCAFTPAQDWVVFQSLTQLFGTQMAFFGIDSILQVAGKLAA